MTRHVSMTQEPGTDNPERSLWRGVISQALNDGCYGRRHLVDNAPDGEIVVYVTKHEARRARDWFSSAGRDFHQVCDLADFNPGIVKSAAAMLFKRFDDTVNLRHFEPTKQPGYRAAYAKMNAKRRFARSFSA